MTEKNLLSKTELEVAQALWKLKKGTVREVRETLPADRDFDFWTVQTLLRRLEEKEYVKSTKQGRIRVYQARVKPTTVIRRLTDDFVNRVFEGDALPLFLQLIQNHDMSDEQIEKLRALLDDKKGE